jgi:hypothetical protein
VNPSPNHPLRTIAVAALAAIAALSGASAFHIDLEPVFTGGTDLGTRPIAVAVENDGPSAKGVLRVTSGGTSMDYPVDLPAGSIKRIITYPYSSMPYEAVTVTLDTDQGLESKQVHFDNSRSGQNTVLMISDKPGSLSFLKNTRIASKSAPSFPGSPSANDSWSIADAYCTPEDAPPRALAYSSVNVVFLGPGAQRISDGTVEALKTWAMEGGSLVFIGGESSLVLSDSRWQSVLPATQFSSKVVKTSDTLASMGQSELSGPITLLEPTDLHGAAVRADGSTIITAESGFGFGRVIYLAFDPLVSPLRQWDGKSYAMTDILRASLVTRPGSNLDSYSGEPGVPNTGYAVGLAPAVIEGPPAAAGRDPFSAKLPATGSVFGVLAGYFLAVVPLNFLILRKLKRGELAWFTAPVLSLGFASILFKSAGSLYSEKLSTASRGVVLMRQGDPNAVFVGNTQIFLPQGGRYNLRMAGVDSIGTGNGTAQYADNSPDLDAVDNGAVTIPNMLASNLAFRQIDYRQQLPIGDLYSISMRRDGGTATCIVKNASTSALTNAVVFVGKHAKRVNTIQPGESLTVKVDLTADEGLPGGPDTTDGFMASTLGYYGGAALQANLTNFRPGPQIGQQVDYRTQVTLLAFSKDALGGIR